MQKSPAVRVINATKAKNRFGAMLKAAYQAEEHLIIERDGIPVVAILPVQDYEHLMATRKNITEQSNTPALIPIIGLSEPELVALAQTVVSPEKQEYLQQALEQNRDQSLSPQSRMALDDILDQLLDEVDQIALLKARALYTLKLHRSNNPPISN